MSKLAKGEREVKTPIVKAACGCLIITLAHRIKGGKTNLSGFEIKHCPLHKAAPDLLKACKHFYNEMNKQATEREIDARLLPIWNEAEAALAKAEKE